MTINWVSREFSSFNFIVKTIDILRNICEKMTRKNSCVAALSSLLHIDQFVSSCKYAICDVPSRIKVQLEFYLKSQ